MSQALYKDVKLICSICDPTGTEIIRKSIELSEINLDVSKDQSDGSFHITWPNTIDVNDPDIFSFITSNNFNFSLVSKMVALVPFLITKKMKDNEYFLANQRNYFCLMAQDKSCFGLRFYIPLKQKFPHVVVDLQLLDGRILPSIASIHSDEWIKTDKSLFSEDYRHDGLLIENADRIRQEIKDMII
jgi:hypothetical protein